MTSGLITSARTYHNLPQCEQGYMGFIPGSNRLYTKGSAGLCMCAEVNLDGDRSQTGQSKRTDKGQVRDTISDWGSNELTRTQETNPNTMLG